MRQPSAILLPCPPVSDTTPACRGDHLDLPIGIDLGAPPARPELRFASVRES